MTFEAFVLFVIGAVFSESSHFERTIEGGREESERGTQNGKGTRRLITTKTRKDTEGKSISQAKSAKAVSSCSSCPSW